MPREESDDEGGAFSAAVAEWDRRLAAVGDALDASAPSPDLWDRIDARVDALEAARGTRTVPAASGVWEPASPGVTRKLLHVDAAGGWRAFLLRIEPGATVPGHAHPILEECFVLEGSFEVGGEHVSKGDLHLASAGRDHGPITSPGGALLYIRAAIAR